MSLFGYTDYRKYLHHALGDGQRNGRRQRLAETLACQAAHLSQVLNGKNHLSVEHSFGVSRFFGHSEKESEYFLLILQGARAGSVEAEQYFMKKAQVIKQESLKIQDRISSEKRELSPEEQAIYYGDGQYALAHVATSLPQIKTAEDLAEIMGIDVETVHRVVDFLMRTGLVVRQKDQLKTGPGHTHLGADSPHIKKHHLNLRMAALRKIERGVKKSDVHYATYYTLSKADAFRLKDRILDLVDQNLKTIAPSPEEVLYCNVIDFFEVSK